MKTIIINNWLKFLNRESRDIKFESVYHNGSYVNVFVYSEECEKFLIENDIAFQISEKEPYSSI